jgi:hypothetical protein
MKKEMVFVNIAVVMNLILNDLLFSFCGHPYHKEAKNLAVLNRFFLSDSPRLYHTIFFFDVIIE